jgi:hypothetical protein
MTCKLDATTVRPQNDRLRRRLSFAQSKLSLVVVLCVAAIGCGGPGRIEPPSIEPSAAGAAALKAYDQDGDGGLSREECTRCPGLADEAFGRYDADGDARITGQEITARLQSMLDKKIGLVPAWCTVTLDGQPLAGAVVQLEPEVFLDGMLGAARGTTGVRGTAQIDSVAAEGDETLPGTPPGIYRVRITHPEVNLPARYNQETTLGMEIAPLEQGADNKTFRLTRQ